MVRVVDFYVITGNLYKMGSNEVVRRYISDYERQRILTKAHGGVA